ncbi:IclR family transcriptional regulator [Nocardia sp. NPDC004123]
MTEVLDAFAAGPDRLSLPEVAAITGLPRTTVFRIMQQLVGMGWLEQDYPGFRLGRRAFGLAARQQDWSGLRAAANPRLVSLYEGVGAVAHLGVLEGNQVRYLDKIGGPTTGVPSAIGLRVPAERTVLGWAMMAAMPPEHVDVLFAGGSSTEDSDSSDLLHLHTQLSRIRMRHGLAVSNVERCPMGIASVAAPILSPDGDVVGAISAAGVGLRLDAVGPMVLAAARNTSKAFFPSGSGGNPHWLSQERKTVPMWRVV